MQRHHIWDAGFWLSGAVCAAALTQFFVKEGERQLTGSDLIWVVVLSGVLCALCKVASNQMKDREKIVSDWRDSFKQMGYIVNGIMGTAGECLPVYALTFAKFGVDNWIEVFTALPWPEMDPKEPLGTWVKAMLPKASKVEDLAYNSAGYLRYHGGAALNAQRMKMRDIVEGWARLRNDPQFVAEANRVIADFRTPLVLYAYLEISEAVRLLETGTVVPSAPRGEWIKLPEAFPVLLDPPNINGPSASHILALLRTRGGA